MFMKTMKFVGFALMAVLASVGFTACGGDDGDSGGGVPSGKQLVKMTEEYSSKTYVYDFTYDSQGRVVKVDITKNGVSNGNYTYAYSTNSITETHNYSSGSTSRTQYTLENGCIVKETRSSSSEMVEYTYNNGYLATKSRIYSGSTTPSRVYTYSWSNGNLVSESREDKVKTYEYTNYVAPTMCIDLWDLDNNLMGFYGKTPRNLPSKLIDDGSEELTYDWTMNGGFPIKLILTEKSSKGDDVNIITFEWK